LYIANKKISRKHFFELKTFSYLKILSPNTLKNNDLPGRVDPEEPSTCGSSLGSDSFGSRTQTYSKVA
jgi:hypothetical protein